MNLQTTFPEIHKFFLKEHFDSVQLKVLQESISKNYVDKELYTKAISYFKLELMKYEILLNNSDPKASKNNPLRIRTNCLIKITDKINFPKEIYNLCVKLKFSRFELNQICLSNGVDIADMFKLTDNEFDKLKQVFEARYEEIRIIEEKEFTEKVKPTNNNSFKKSGRKFQTQKSWTESVFDLIGTYSLGKVIYIRSK